MLGCFLPAALLLFLVLSRIPFLTIAGQNNQSSCGGSCALGRYRATTSTTCAACPVGYFQNATNATQCRACLRGRHQEHEGAATCLPCGRGKWQNETRMAMCKGCGINWWSGEEGWARCKSCPKGYSTTGLKMMTWCVPCSKGKFNNEMASACEACPGGYYQDDKNATRCKPCAAARFSNATGRTDECRFCPAGYFTGDLTKGILLFNQTTCKHCQAGYYSSKNGSESK